MDTRTIHAYGLTITPSCYFLKGTNSLEFFFNDTATTEIYTLSLHDALPIWGADEAHGGIGIPGVGVPAGVRARLGRRRRRRARRPHPLGGQEPPPPLQKGQR